MLKHIRASLGYVRHLPDNDVAPFGFAQRRFDLRSPTVLSFLCLVVLAVPCGKNTDRKGRNYLNLRDSTDDTLVKYFLLCAGVLAHLCGSRCTPLLHSAPTRSEHSGPPSLGALWSPAPLMDCPAHCRLGWPAHCLSCTKKKHVKD